MDRLIPPYRNSKLSIGIEKLRNDAIDVEIAGNKLIEATRQSTYARKALIAEARGILESSGVSTFAEETDGARLVASEYNRLREILDELERLP